MSLWLFLELNSLLMHRSYKLSSVATILYLIGLQLVKEDRLNGSEGKLSESKSGEIKCIRLFPLDRFLIFLAQTAT